MPRSRYCHPHLMTGKPRFGMEKGLVHHHTARHGQSPRLVLIHSTNTQRSPGFICNTQDGGTRMGTPPHPAASQDGMVLRPSCLGTLACPRPLAHLLWPSPDVRLQQRLSASESRAHRGSCPPVGGSWGPPGVPLGLPRARAERLAPGFVPGCGWGGRCHSRPRDTHTPCLGAHMNKNLGGPCPIPARPRTGGTTEPEPQPGSGRAPGPSPRGQGWRLHQAAGCQRPSHRGALAGPSVRRK